MGKHGMEEVLQDCVFNNFYKISRIPRGSYHEKQISDYLVKWAGERGLFAVQDHLNNVLIRKQAAAGCEKASGVLLQAHMDMVCEKIPESDHDFSKDPIPLVLEGDFLTTGGQTTLGADDGIGMALAMAVLEEDSWRHPLLEVLFTVAEEEDMSGAIGFDTDLLESTYLINLDNVDDQEILCGSCGGEAVEVEIQAEWEQIPNDWVLYQLNVQGLKGGHSGEDINKGRGNANRILARALMELEKHMKIKMCSLKGGSFRLAIPREAGCVIALPGVNASHGEEIISRLEADIREEFQSAGVNLNISFTQSGEQYTKACDVRKLISLILFSPDGILEMSSVMENVVSTSNNVGELYLNEEGYSVIYEIRAACNSARDHAADIIGRLADVLGGTCKVHSSYSSWAYRQESVLRDVAIEVLEAVNGSRPKVYCVHAGLECGCFADKKSDLDAISIGPNCRGLHSPEEKVSISSTKKVYGVLRRILERV